MKFFVSFLLPLQIVFFPIFYHYIQPFFSTFPKNASPTFPIKPKNALSLPPLRCENLRPRTGLLCKQCHLRPSLLCRNFFKSRNFAAKFLLAAEPLHTNARGSKKIRAQLFPSFTSEHSKIFQKNFRSVSARPLRPPPGGLQFFRTVRDPLPQQAGRIAVVLYLCYTIYRIYMVSQARLSGFRSRAATLGGLFTFQPWASSSRCGLGQVVHAATLGGLFTLRPWAGSSRCGLGQAVHAAPLGGLLFYIYNIERQMQGFTSEQRR